MTPDERSETKISPPTVLPANSDSDVMFCLQSYQGLRIHRIGLIHKWSIDSRMLKWSVQVSVLLSNCKQSITSLSVLVCTTVDSLVSPIHTQVVFQKDLIEKNNRQKKKKHENFPRVWSFFHRLAHYVLIRPMKFGFNVK